MKLTEIVNLTEKPRTGKTQAAAQARTQQRQAQQRQPAQPATQQPVQPVQPVQPGQQEPPVGATFTGPTGAVYSYLGANKGGWHYTEPNGNTEKTDMQDEATREYWKSQDPAVQTAGAAPAQTATAAPVRLPTGQKGILYGKEYVYDQDANRWYDTKTQQPARGQAHRKLMLSFRADDYGRRKPPGLIARAKAAISNKLGGEFGQGIDPEAGMAQKIGGTLGSMVGRGVGALVGGRAKPAAESTDLSRLRTLAGIDPK